MGSSDYNFQYFDHNLHDDIVVKIMVELLSCISRPPFGHVTVICSVLFNFINDSLDPSLMYLLFDGILVVY